MASACADLGVHLEPHFGPETGAIPEARRLIQRFSGQKPDLSSKQYDFLMRECSSVQSRWWTPDPAGLAAVDPNNPQTWNRYAYVNGRPTETVDNNGEWPTDIHNQIYEMAFPGLGNSMTGALEGGSAYI